MALAVGLQLAPPERLRFFVASDSPDAVAEFKAGVAATLARDFPGLTHVDNGSSVVFNASGDQSTRGAALDMLLLGMANETGADASRVQYRRDHNVGDRTSARRHERAACCAVGP